MFKLLEFREDPARTPPSIGAYIGRREICLMTLRTGASLPIIVLAFMSLAPPPPPSLSQETGSKTWVGRSREIEEYLRTAECVRMEDMAGSNAYAKRCIMRPGGPVARMLWKPSVPRDVVRGFRERYKAEIAAYELDKLLKLDMVPPAVERELLGYKGSATLWVEQLFASNDGASAAPADRSRWEKQLAQMMMFDALIGNRHRNGGNLLRDAAWNMILLDHGGAFAPGSESVGGLTRIDRDFWARIDKMTRQELDATLGPWLGESDIVAILDRREKMKTVVNRRACDAGFAQ